MSQLEPRRKNRLSIEEVDAEWVYTATAHRYRFHEGTWQCSVNVYYGKDQGWFGWSSEPTASAGNQFIEILPGHEGNAARYADLLSRTREVTPIVAK